MTVWILIVVTSFGRYASGNTVTFQEFNSNKSCQIAADLIKKDTDINTYCTEK